MNYIGILGKALKTDFLCDLFETYDVDVVYEYDRTYENIADEYRAKISEMGIEFVFDESQRLKTMFMYEVSHDGFNPFEGEDPRTVPFATGVEAMKFAKDNSIQAVHQEAKKDSFFGDIPEWVKFNYGGYSVHYQFAGNGVEMVTLQLENA